MLIPEQTDAVSGYRLYGRKQLVALRHIVVLKDLGLPLSDIAGIVNSQISKNQVHILLSTHRANLVLEIAAARSNLMGIDNYVSNIEKDTAVPNESVLNPEIKVDLKSVDGRLVAQLSAVSESWAPSDIGSVIAPLYPELFARMKKAGVDNTGPSMAWYEDTDEGRIIVHATLTIEERPAAEPATLGFEIVQLPAIELIASTLHHGSMDNCDTTYEALMEWVSRHGYQPVGYSRELDIECGPDGPTVTELQVTVVKE